MHNLPTQHSHSPANTTTVWQQCCRTLVVLCCLLGTFTAIQAQTSADNKQSRQAEEYYNAGLYDKALPMYKELAAKYPDDQFYNYFIGLCYLNSQNQKKEAIDYLKRVTESQSDTIPEAFFYLGQAYQVNHKFPEAIRYYEFFKLFLEDNDEGRVLRNEANRRIRQCGYGKEMVSKPWKVNIRNLGPAINTPYGDYGEVLSADEDIMIFTSRREGSTGGYIADDGEYYEDVYYSLRINNVWQQSQRIDSAQIKKNNKKPNNIKKAKYLTELVGINKVAHDAAIGLSADGQKLFIYRSEDNQHDIFICLLQGTKWSPPERLPEPVNTKAAWEGHATLSADEKELYFSSDREGGFGGKDIYKCRRMPGGKWSEPVNLGPIINTRYDEDSPFIHPDGVSLYFSSQGHNSMGGYDVFVTENKGGSWSEPKNMGYPINTAEDDLYFILSGDGERAYISSGRPGGFGRQDIYVIDLPEDYYQKPVYTLMRGLITECGTPTGADILVYDNANGELMGLYRANDATGKYLIAIPAGKNYNVTIRSNNGQVFSSENIFFPRQEKFIRIDKDIDLLCGELGDKVCLNNIFFEGYSSVLKAESEPELENILKFMRENPLVSIRIISYVDKKYVTADVAYARSISVSEYLMKKGIQEERLFPEGFAVFDDPSTIDKKDKVCIQIIGGHLGPKGETSNKTEQELDDFYYRVLKDCGDYVFDDVLFKIQIGAFKNAPRAAFDDLRNKEWLLYLKMEKEIAADGITRFTIGPFETLNQAEDLRQKVIDEGIVGAWTVPYIKGYRSNIEQIEVLCKSDSVNKRLFVEKEYVIDDDTSRPILNPEIKLILLGTVVEELRGEEFPMEAVDIQLLNKTQKWDEEGTALTPAEGDFQFELYTNQDYVVMAKKEGYADGRYELSTHGFEETDTLYANILLEPKYELLNLEGIVVMKETQEPVEYAKVTIANRTRGVIENEIATLKDGKFLVNVSSNTNYDIIASKSGLTNDKKLLSTINMTTLDKPFVKLELTEAPCLKLDGFVVERDLDEPLENVFIELYNLETREVVAMTTGVDGVFEGCLDPESDFVVRGSKKNYFTNCIEVSSKGVPPDEAIFAKLELEKIEIGKSIRIENIYYDFNKWDIRPDAAFELNKIVSMLNNNPTIRIELGSHTDCRGSDSYNKWLSQKRAESAVSYIVKNGISASRITAKGYGETQLVNKCDDGVSCTEQEHQENRRTEFKVIGFVEGLVQSGSPDASNTPAQQGVSNTRPGMIDCPNIDIQ